MAANKQFIEGEKKSELDIFRSQIGKTSLETGWPLVSVLE